MAEYCECCGAFVKPKIDEVVERRETDNEWDNTKSKGKYYR